MVAKKKKKKKEVLKMLGRPSEYYDEHCEKVLNHMAGGFSFESFAGLIGVDRSTIYRWLDEQPAFKDAKKAGTEKSRLYWENIGVKGSAGQMPGWNPTGWIYNVKNRFPNEWNDRKEAEKSPLEIRSIHIQLPGQETEQVISMEPKSLEASEDE